MVSWGRAFKAALVLLAFTILWGIIGGGIIIASTLVGVLGSIQYVHTPWGDVPIVNPEPGAVGIMIIAWIIGFLVIILGTYASIFKVFTELIVEEIKKIIPASATMAITAQASQPTVTSAPACPKCGNPLTYVQQYQRWYCPTCKEYQ